MADFVLGVWREASRQDVEHAADRVAKLLAPKLPADLLVLRRFDVQRARIETVTTGACRQRTPPASARSECTHEQFTRVLEWCRAGQLRRGRPGAADTLMSV